MIDLTIGQGLADRTYWFTMKEAVAKTNMGSRVGMCINGAPEREIPVIITAFFLKHLFYRKLTADFYIRLVRGYILEDDIIHIDITRGAVIRYFDPGFFPFDGFHFPPYTPHHAAALTGGH